MAETNQYTGELACLSVCLSVRSSSILPHPTPVFANYNFRYFLLCTFVLDVAKLLLYVRHVVVSVLGIELY